MSTEPFEGMTETTAEPKRPQICNIMVQFTIVEDEEGLAVKKQIDKATGNLNNVRINFSILQQRAVPLVP